MGDNLRTTQQNRALHLYFEQLAEALNEAGFDMKKTLRQDIDIPWTRESVKEHLWKPVSEVMFSHQTTTLLDTKKIDKIYDVVNRIIGERTGVFVPFPNIDLIENNETIKNN